MLFAFVFGALLVASCGAVNLPGVPTDFSATNAVLSAVSDDIATKFEEEYMSYRKTGIESAALRQISAQLASSHSKKDLFTKEIHELSPADTFFTCTTCRAIVNVLARMFRAPDGELNGPNNKEIAKGIMLDICDRLKIQTKEVCEGLFESNWPTCEFILRTTDIESRTGCSLFMEVDFCNVKEAGYNWSLSLDNSVPAITAPKADKPSKGSNDLHVLHVTDIHLDPLYVPGALAECEEPLCCQRHKETAQGTSKAAGYWGDYRDCDAPWHMVEDAFAHIKKTHAKIDYIYQTGDVVDHMVWATSEEKNNEVLSRVSNKLAEVFPGVPVYSCIGNHEPHPVNVFSPVDAPDHVNTNWLYQHLYNDWSKWLPASTKDTILKGGYYTVSPKAGFRIIALNNNDCYNMNWWLFYSGTDKQPQLEWFHTTLLAAEKAGEYVHILAHIPSGDGSCWSTWSREYNRVIERFSNTISGIFNGHSHKDEMNVHYSKNGHAIGMSWNGGSLTTFSNKNPNYLVYEVEQSKMQVVDFSTWIFDLTKANEHGADQSPAWFEEYVFSKEFTDDLSPAGIDALLDKMADNPDLLRKYWRFKHTSAEPSLAWGCDKGCMLGTICRLATTVNDQTKRCEALKAKLTIALEKEPTPAPETTTVAGVTTTEEPEDDGAASIVALRLSSVIALVLFVKYIF